ncbi:MAG: AAA family ATPase, partial [Bacteroidaceae bacterium]|nr:AAA family ATPase [Bacteroidaceae bacterium]
MLLFTSLSIENFGPFKGKQNIDFTRDNGVTIIWGNNGLGKTTLLNIFRYALFGIVQGRGNKTHSLRKIANWESYDEGIYGFKVTLKMIADGVPCELTRQFTLKDGVSKPEKDSDYKEDVFLKRDTTFLSQDEREHTINSIMPEQVSRFFLFDGELLQEYEDLLANESSTGIRIKEAIERILGVPILTNGLADVKTAEKEYSNRLSKVAQKNQNTQVLGNLLEAKQAELKKHEDEYTILKTTQIQLNAKRHSLEEEMKQTEKARELLSERKMLKDIITRKDEIKKTKIDEMKMLTKNAWQGMLSERIKNVLEFLEKDIKIIENKKTKHLISEQMLEQIREACKGSVCPICGQHLSEAIRQVLKDKMESMVGFDRLSTEDQNKLIMLQGRRSQLLKLSVEELKLQVDAVERTIADITVDISDAEQRISEIDKNLREAGDLTRAASINNEYARCLQKISNTETGLDNERDIINRVSSEIKNLEDKLKHQATDTELLKAEKKRDLCEKVKKIFEEGVNLYRDRLKQKVEKDASNIFTRISNQAEYINLQINENYGLSIVHQSGRIVEIRSAGYEHIVALSLIGALHKNAPLQGPIIMDSPFGRLDPEHKRKITDALPTLADQVILLVYSGEIDDQLARR